MSVQSPVDFEVALISREGERVRSSFFAVKMSNLITQVFDDYSDEDVRGLLVDNVLEIQTPQVEKRFLLHIVEFCQHHSRGPPIAPIEKPFTKSFQELVSPWDAHFFEFKNGFFMDDLIGVMNGANYLDIKSLVELCCTKLASLMRGKTREELRQLYQIENDFSAEEEAEILRNNPWA